MEEVRELRKYRAEIAMCQRQGYIRAAPVSNLSAYCAEAQPSGPDVGAARSVRSTITGRIRFQGDHAPRRHSAHRYWMSASIRRMSIGQYRTNARGFVHVSKVMSAGSRW
jgi:hypothetical protein